MGAYALDTSTIRHLPLGVFSVFVGLLSIFALYFLYQWYKNFIQSRALADRPCAKIRSASQGYVELQGIQQFFNKKPTIAPLSKSPCTWYRYTIEQLSTNKWVKIEEGNCNNPFEIVDGTGRCIIQPQGAHVITPLVDSWLGYRRTPLGKPKNIFWKLFSLFGRYRYCEWRMEQGMPLYASGNFATLEETNTLSSEKCSNRYPFILSVRDEKKVVRAFKTDATIWLIAYILLISFIIWLILLRWY